MLIHYHADALGYDDRGSDSGGGAGGTGRHAHLCCSRVHGTSVVTAVTAQNTLGVQDVYHLPVDAVVAQMNVVFSDIEIRCVKTGMLATVEVAEAAAECFPACGSDRG